MALDIGSDDYIRAAHWQDIDLKAWLKRWPNFHPSEVCTPDTKAVVIYVPFMDALQRVRTRFGKPMHMTSVYRSPAHNKRVGGVPGSQHVKGKAGDCALQRLSDGPVLERIARDEGMTGIGRYPGKRFIHMDLRSGGNATWGRW